MKRSKTSVVVGSHGQDGTLLCSLLRGKGRQVFGIARRFSTLNESICATAVDIFCPRQVAQVLVEWKPSEVYYLAACHSSAENSELYESTEMLYDRSQNVHVRGLINFLSAIEKYSPETKLFYAGSSLVYGKRSGDIQDESTLFDPVGIYGITKAQGLWLCREYREQKAIFAAGGILFNHESSLRPKSFLTSKVIDSAIRISLGFSERLQIGNLASRVDWGLAVDYVTAFESILALDEPGDYIVASGVTHSVEEFVEAVFCYFNLEWRNYVDIVPDLLYRAYNTRCGNSSKLERDTGISLRRPFVEFVEMLVLEHIHQKYGR